jgi:hypothetical protein
MTESPQRPGPGTSLELHSELLILPDGRILVHNLTQPMALALRELNPGDNSINPRAETKLELQVTASQIVS